MRLILKAIAICIIGLLNACATPVLDDVKVQALRVFEVRKGSHTIYLLGERHGNGFVPAASDEAYLKLLALVDQLVHEGHGQKPRSVRPKPGRDSGTSPEPCASRTIPRRQISGDDRNAFEACRDK